MTWGESVDAKGHEVETGRTPQPWCRYSASCYKSGQPLHTVHPLYGKAYTDGCPRDGDACPSALLASGLVTYKALPEDLMAMSKLKRWGTCKECGRWFEKRHGNERYCSDACRADAGVLTRKRWAENNRERLREHQREYQRRRYWKDKEGRS